MQRNITTPAQQINNFFIKPTNGSNLTSVSSTDMLSRLMNETIRKSIESYVRIYTDIEKEILLYLDYYFKKWNGNIQIPIKNLCDRFKVSARWVHKLLSRIYDAGWVITVNRGYGRKVTRRTLTERGRMVLDAIKKGFGFVKQAIPKKSADYCADYSQPHTNYISTKVDIVQAGVANNQEIPESDPFKHISNLRSLLKKNE